MKICKYISNEKKPLFIMIMGGIGSGKTTLARDIHRYCFPELEFKERYDVDFTDLEKGKGYYFLFDDFSYKITGRSQRDREKLYTLFRIRHILESDDLVLTFVAHYIRSLAVFIRSAQVRILTSITEPEIQLYSQEYLFTPSSLWDYFHYYTAKKGRYIILLHSQRSGEHILDITKKEV